MVAEAAHLDVTGETEEPDGTTRFLMWELLHELRPTDRLRFDFGSGSESSRAPETGEDVAEPEAARTEISWPPSQSEILAMEARPALNPALAWRFAMTGREASVVRPDDGRQHLSFGLLWNNRRPETIRVSLRCNSLREAVAREGGVEFVSESLPLGSWFELEIGV